MAEGMDEVQRDIAATRARLADTVAAIDSKVSGAVEGVRQRVDVFEMARQHPWIALGAAIGIGVAIGSSGADRKAAGAAAGAARATGRKVRDKVRDLREGHSDEAAAYAADYAPEAVQEEDDRGGPLSRFMDEMGEVLSSRAKELIEAITHASHDIGGAESAQAGDGVRNDGARSPAAESGAGTAGRGIAGI